MAIKMCRACYDPSLCVWAVLIQVFVFKLSQEYVFRMVSVRMKIAFLSNTRNGDVNVQTRLCVG